MVTSDECKRFKDPVYGYIVIPNEIVKSIIDTASFQRLRYIKQTSYLPVYSAALHNRFVHSIGVYFLGSVACESIISNSSDTNIVNNEFDIKKIFELACLLHDIGHAPFSHSGEDFYIDVNKTIYSQLKECINDENFTADVDYYHKYARIAAPHEIMSVILSIKMFSHLFTSDKEKDFFARCITGYKYRDVESNSFHAILNGFISLLNSSTIDVDRLDYLIRDAYVMGYNSISIDYSRLLEGITLVAVQDNAKNTTYQLAFKKSSLSVIENVIYAHDLERKWIQNHPVILYEVFLLKQIISLVQADYSKNNDGKDLFSLNSLLPKPTQSDKVNSLNRTEYLLKILSSHLKNLHFTEDLKKELNCFVDDLSRSQKVFLLCDDDIVHFAKSITHPICNELFDRSLRRHPIWKSEAEYKIFVDGFVGKKSVSKLMHCISILDGFIKNETPSFCINEEAIKICKDKLSEIKNSSDLSRKDKETMRERYLLIQKWLIGFKKIYKTQKLKYFDFVIVPTSIFVSGFKKADLSNTLIYFSKTKQTVPLKELVDMFTIKDNDRREYFYIYYKRGENDNIDPLYVGKQIAQLVLT